MYVIIEGIDTSGKSTQIELLKEIYQDAIFTKEPGGTSFGKHIRNMILNDSVSSSKAELFLFLADRAEHFEEIIKPNKNKLIISDRGLISGIAYAKTNHEELEIGKLIELNLIALENTLPEIIFFLKVDEKLIQKRMSLKSHDKIEKRGLKYLLKVQENMQKILELMNIKYIQIDASKSKKEILKIITENIGK